MKWPECVTQTKVALIQFALTHGLQDVHGTIESKLNLINRDGPLCIHMRCHSLNPLANSAPVRTAGRNHCKATTASAMIPNLRLMVATTNLPKREVTVTMSCNVAMADRSFSLSAELTVTVMRQLVRVCSVLSCSKGSHSPLASVTVTVTRYSTVIDLL
jgi:hypothetical protein